MVLKALMSFWSAILCRPSRGNVRWQSKLCRPPFHIASSDPFSSTSTNSTMPPPSKVKDNSIMLGKCVRAFWFPVFLLAISRSVFFFAFHPGALALSVPSIQMTLLKPWPTLPETRPPIFAQLTVWLLRAFSMALRWQLLSPRASKRYGRPHILFMGGDLFLLSSVRVLMPSSVLFWLIALIALIGCFFFRFCPLQPVTYVNVPEAAVIQTLTSFGITGWMLDRLIDLHRIIRDGQSLASVSNLPAIWRFFYILILLLLYWLGWVLILLLPHLFVCLFVPCCSGVCAPGPQEYLVLERLLGRKAVTFQEWVDKNVAAFQ